MGEESSLTLDHVALVSPDLEASKEDYEKLGFRLTRVSSHQRRPSPDAPVELLGSGNRCAMFRQGYYEILGVTDASRPHEHFRGLAEKLHGVGVIALGCERADELYRSRKDRVPGLKPPGEIGREVPLGSEGEETKTGLFRIVHVDSEAFPEAQLLFVEHLTPDVLWQKSLLDHPNGVQALSAVTICSEDPDETAVRFESVTLRSPEGDGLRFVLDEGVVEMASPRSIAKRFKDIVLPAVPCIAVASLTVSDVEETRRLLKERGVTPHGTDDGIWVRPERAGGVVLHFVAS